MRHFVFVLTFLVLGVGLTACSNTLDGAGRDIEKAGQKISETF